MKTEVLNCWLCGAEADSWELTVARVCKECFANAEDRLAKTGHRVTVEQDGKLITVYAPPGREPRVGLIFGPENLKAKVSKIFLAEVQVGQRRFDDKVYLEFADKSDVPLLRGVEVEELIIELVDSGVVHLIDDHADVHLNHKSEHDTRELVLLCASLLNAVVERQKALGQR